MKHGVHILLVFAIAVSGCSLFSDTISERHAKSIAIKTVKPRYRGYGKILAPGYKINKCEQLPSGNWKVKVSVRGNKCPLTFHTVSMDDKGKVLSRTWTDGFGKKIVPKKNYENPVDALFEN